MRQIQRTRLCARAEGIVISENVDKTLGRWYLESQPQIVTALKSRLGYSADLEDLAQEVYLRLLRADTYGIASSIGQTGGLLSKPAYKTTDLKFLVNLDNWMLSAYVRNLTEEKIVYWFTAGGYVLGHPRPLGVQVNYRM